MGEISGAASENKSWEDRTVPRSEPEGRASGSRETQESELHSSPVLEVVYFLFFSFSFCIFLFETKAQLTDSWRSEDPLLGATLMYCCPISAFNWCPRGRAGRELGCSLLSTLLHTEKVKFITHCGNPLGKQGAREAEKGKWQLHLAEGAFSNFGGIWEGSRLRVFCSGFCAEELGRLRR